MEQTQNVIITNSNFSSNGRHGIWVGDKTQNISILSSTIDSNGYFNPVMGNGNGINCDPQSDGAISNLFIQNNTIANSSNIAIVLNAVTNEQIIRNTIRGTGYCIKATGTTNTTLRGNSCIGSGIMSKGNSGFIVHNGAVGRVSLTGLLALVFVYLSCRWG